MNCSLCAGPTSQLFVHHGYWVRGCQICGHRNADVAPRADHIASTYNDGYFEGGGGAGYQNYFREAEILIDHGRRYARLASNYMGVGKVLDVGSAAGFVLKGFIGSGWRGEGIEPNSRMAEYAREKTGVPVTTSSLEDFRSKASFDLVSMIQVLAHFVDPRAALSVADSLTRPEGFWLVETWNRESLTARFFEKHWHEYSPPSVLHWFSPEGLRRLAAEFHFQEVARGKPAKWISGSHAKSLLRYRTETSTFARPLTKLVALLPDRWNLRYPAEDLFWMILQKT